MTTSTEFDLAWAVEEDVPPGNPRRDSQFVFKRVPELITEKATEGRPQRVLEVACGLGGQLALLRERCDEAWGLDASTALARYCRQRFAEEGGAPVVAAVAEALPFQSGSFDRVVCQGSLDHFVKPRQFMREVARVLRPDGRAIIGISNFDSLSCVLGRTLYRVQERRGAPVYRGRNYWEIPHNHAFRGTYALLVRLGEPDLELVECRGVSMLWLFHRWTQLMERLPGPLAWSTMKTIDRVAYYVPALADLLVSVWRPRANAHG